MGGSSPTRLHNSKFTINFCRFYPIIKRWQLQSYKTTQQQASQKLLQVLNPTKLKTYKSQTQSKITLRLVGSLCKCPMLQVRECDFNTKPLAQHPDSLSPFNFKTSVSCQVGGKKGMILWSYFTNLLLLNTFECR